MQKSFFLFSFNLIAVLFTIAQQSLSSSNLTYPLFIKPKLNASFGEMRPNHFHMGLDLSTEAKENLPVRAPADGYIARIKIEEGGFGRAIYINHPNGRTTVYAHMNRFLPAVETYIEKKQYEKETWKIDLQVPAGMFRVQNGQLIGYSGNTGSSEGPHLHFELRDTQTEHCLNPLSNGISIADHTAPEPKQLAFYDYEKSIYEQSPTLVALVKKGTVYLPVRPIELPFEKVMVGIVAMDRADASPNPNGIYQAMILQGAQRITGFTLENISYDFTRNQNGHIDYPHRFKGGNYIQMLHRPKFFQAHIYASHTGTSFLMNTQTNTSYEIEVLDVHKNKSLVSFSIRKSGLPVKQSLDGQLISHSKKNIYQKNGIKFEFPSDAFYDSFHMNVLFTAVSNPLEKSSSYQVQPHFIPVNNFFRVSIQSSNGVIDTSRLLIRKIFKNKSEVKKAVSDGFGFSAMFRELGTFQLIEDREPPVVRFNLQQGASIKKGQLLSIAVADNNKSIRSIEVRCDGKWLMFKPTGMQHTYRVDDHLPTGEHLLTAVVVDEAGNKTVAQLQFKRI
jgi:hypothetical protein